MSETTTTVVQYVIEARRPGRDWLIWSPARTLEDALIAYDDALRSLTTSTEYRLVKRTCVITNEEIKPPACAYPRGFPEGGG